MGEHREKLRRGRFRGRFLLSSQRRTLRLRQSLAPGVRKQTVQAPGHVPDVKADRRGPARALPEVLRYEAADYGFGLFERLEDCVRDGLERGRDARHGTS
jgi:hypothetical protein